MSSPKPYELFRWESSHTPTEVQLLQCFEREGLMPSQETFAPGSITPEITHADPLVRMIVSGTLQCSFPGYGVVELHPGDSVDIEAHVCHDLKVMGRDPAVLLTAIRS